MKPEATLTTRVRKYDLQRRTHEFSKAVRNFIKLLPYSIANKEDIRQLVKSSGSVCANYLEAVEAVSKDDFIYRMKICRKEAKESGHWLDLLDVGKNEQLFAIRSDLLQESRELTLIFSASLRTANKNIN